MNRTSLRIDLVKLGELDGLVPHVCTPYGGKLHEASQAHLIISKIALGAQVSAIFLSTVRYIIIGKWVHGIFTLSGGKADLKLERERVCNGGQQPALPSGYC
jgi:hypothetical protein